MRLLLRIEGNQMAKADPVNSRIRPFPLMFFSVFCLWRRKQLLLVENVVVVCKSHLTY